MANNERAEGGVTDGDELAGLGDGTEEAISEAILRTSVDVNGEPIIHAVTILPHTNQAATTGQNGSRHTTINPRGGQKGGP